MTPDVAARAAWSRLTEPGDVVAGALIATLGAPDALAWLAEVRPVVRAGRHVDLPGTGESARRLSAAAARWATRWDTLDVARDLAHLTRLGGTVLVPGAPGWPAGLADLGPAAPACLWVRGALDLHRLCARSVALIGARACTTYGEHVAAQIAGGVADAGWTVVSGGAYGIDAVAHRVAVASGAPTVAFLAGGVDRPYPAGNARLLAAIAEGGGACVSEVPPGAVPSRTRFLQRNRLIAAAARGTVVVEAAWRSGALSTAGHAAALLRPVGAVPGPVTSAASAGCHRLLRDGAAVCVTDADEVLELVRTVTAATGPADGVAAPDAGAPEHGRREAGRREAGPREVDRWTDDGPVAGHGRAEAARPPGDGRVDLDGLDEAARRAFDALPVRRGATVESLTRVAGLAPPEVAAALGALELAGLAVSSSGRWRRIRPGGEAGAAGRIGHARPV